MVAAAVAAEVKSQSQVARLILHFAQIHMFLQIRLIGELLALLIQSKIKEDVVHAGPFPLLVRLKVITSSNMLNF